MIASLSVPDATLAATVVLAFVTWRLVVATSEIARGGQRQAELTTAAFRLQVEPHIVAVADGPPKQVGGEEYGFRPK
jgi:hypothetical protein